MTDGRFLGIDLGGTNTKLVVLEVDGKGRTLVASASVPTGNQDPPADVIARLAAAGRDLVRQNGPVLGAGVGVPGLFDDTDGRIVMFTNLPIEWNGHAFGRPLAELLGLSTWLINDARAFTLAESTMGAAAGCATVVCLTLGTGVGGGIVVDGRLRWGPFGRAGEAGHQVVDPDGPLCGCGNRGCVEAFATSAALCRAAGQSTSEAVFAAAASGDERASEAVRGMVARLALGIGNLVTVLWPERVVIGGGVAAAGAPLFAPLREAVVLTTPLVDPASWDIVPAALGPTAGAVGAALWAAERLGGDGAGVRDARAPRR